MKNISIKSLLFLLAILASQASFGLGDVRDAQKKNPIPGKAANCAPSSQTLTMEFNDVSALLQQGGRLFQGIEGGSVAAYEIPKGSGLRAIFAGSLWMGGLDANGQLKLAAVRFRQIGNDFWAGPLTVTAGTGTYDPKVPAGNDVVRPYGPADIQPDQCVEYDRFFTISKGDVISFKNWFDAQTTGDDVETPTNETMLRITNWPAHGETGLGQDFYLAPFYDNDENGAYDPSAGDYPWFDDILGNDDVECGIDRRVTLFGDETNWWVFNDKGNIHTETGGDPIGMEIRAQAFSFATNDEVNRMTFYNYEMINRGTQTLFNTFFSQYLDPDLGNSADDFVGCDVSRGLGFCYNGDEVDDGIPASYGSNPPAIGVDFFEGPYLDADGFDNPGPKFDSIAGKYVSPPFLNARDSNGIVYRGIGTGYSDGIIDNERFGMRRFTYFTNGASFPYTDPSSASEYYNFMEGKWANGSEMYYGGTGINGSILSDYMFPGDSDTLNWATNGEEPGYDWDEAQGGAAPGDRRFVQSAGPFTLRPGAVNNITIGIVYGRGSSGVASSIAAMKAADTKAQALFDACFQILDPPDAPRLRIQELENQLILTLDNPEGSNNVNEEYIEEDKVNILPGLDRFYRFEGYQIYQMKNTSAGVGDISDPTLARLVAQCDLKNFKKDSDGNDLTGSPIGRIINFEFDESLGFSTPVEKVNGENKGIRHSFSLTEDLFATGNRTLVNHKKYYYIAVAYGYNNYGDYDPTDASKLDGQKTPYIASRTSFDKKGISSVEAVPHNPRPELGGTSQIASYGDSPEITRIDGHGNGGRSLELTALTETAIVNNGFVAEPVYQANKGPLNIKVVDPLNLKDGYFEIKFRDFTGNTTNQNAADTASWTINRYDSKGGTLLESIGSEHTIAVDNEQLIPQWGISVQVYQNRYYYETGNEGGSPIQNAKTTDILESSMTFADSSQRWMSGIADVDGTTPLNWIRSGLNEDTAYVSTNLYNNAGCYIDEYIRFANPGEGATNRSRDPQRRWSNVVDGIFAPHRLVGYQCDFMPLAYFDNAVGYPTGLDAASTGRDRAVISYTPSIDIVITADRSKWTKCVVIELGRDDSQTNGGAQTGARRKGTSLDRNGNPIAGETGTSYFPGYAIDVETGARLHMAFGENSTLSAYNGSDMIWNPTNIRFGKTGNPILGGQQPVYVFSHRQKDVNGIQTGGYNMGFYNGATEDISEMTDLMTLVEANNGLGKSNFYSSLTWVGYPTMASNYDVFDILTDVRIKIRLNKEYKKFVATNTNGGNPMYSWNMSTLSTRTGVDKELTSVLDMIGVVPNPYYAFSEYESNRLDTRVKITNLPDVCTVNIYSTNGKLVRTFKKDSPVTSVDWDLNNNTGIPISSGIYLIHVDVPGIGETVLKFFGGIRQVDLQGI